MHLFDVHQDSTLLFLSNVFITKALMSSKSREEKVWMCCASKVKLRGSSKFGLVLMKFLVGRTSARLELSNWDIVSLQCLNGVYRLTSVSGTRPSLNSLKRQRKLYKKAQNENEKKPQERQFEERYPLCGGAIGPVDRKGQYWYTEKSESMRTVICFSLFRLYPSTLDLKWKTGYEFKVLTFNSMLETVHIHIGWEI